MRKNNSPVKKRILIYLDYKGFIKEKFFRDTSISSANFRGKGLESALGSDKIYTILAIYKDLNPTWLMTGEGNMILQDKNIVNEPQSEYQTNNNLIPLLTVDAIGGFGAGEWQITQKDIQDMYLVPDFDEIDFMIRVKGSSMYPKYSSGDIIACRKINHHAFVQWNKPHVISTRDQGIIVKRIKKSEKEECFSLVSDNPAYDPFDLPIDEITGVALVVGTIRLE